MIRLRLPIYNNKIAHAVENEVKEIFVSTSGFAHFCMHVYLAFLPELNHTTQMLVPGLQVQDRVVGTAILLPIKFSPRGNYQNEAAHIRIRL